MAGSIWTRRARAAAGGPGPPSRQGHALQAGRAVPRHCLPASSPQGHQHRCRDADRHKGLVEDGQEEVCRRWEQSSWCTARSRHSLDFMQPAPSRTDGLLLLLLLLLLQPLLLLLLQAS